ncbi:MAG: hypothetical protein RLZZ157_1893 [Pseudomonadota bacterium]|jgi:uncharacterized protein (TIGR02301 family)
MRQAKFRIWHACLALGLGLGLWSVVAFAQPNPQEPDQSPEVTPAIARPEAAPSPPQQAQDTAPQAPAAAVEDAPIDEPPAQPVTWEAAPNYGQAPAPKPEKQRPKRPRKTLSDSKANNLVLGGDGLTWEAGDDAPQVGAQARQRARKLDPAKRSELMRLSRVMGALHALRVSCSGRDDQTYRSRMATLLDLEAPDDNGLRDPLVDAFNGGFQTHGRGTTLCAPDARNQEAALAKEGFKLAQILAARYRPAPKQAEKSDGKAVWATSANVASDKPNKASVQMAAAGKVVQNGGKVAPVAKPAAILPPPQLVQPEPQPNAAAQSGGLSGQR